MDQLVSVFGQGSILGIQQIISSMLLAFVLCMIFAAVYKWTFQGLSYSRSFVHTLVLSGIIVSMLIMAIGNNLARGLGILGTLAIVRFRTPVRDSRDMMFLFATLGVGIACGAGTYNVAIAGTIIISLVMLLLHASPFASRRSYEGLLRFALPASNTTQEKEVDNVMRQCCSEFHLIAMRESAQGELMEYSYHIRLLDPSYQSDLIEKINKIDTIVDAHLIMQRTTVEL